MKTKDLPIQLLLILCVFMITRSAHAISHSDSGAEKAQGTTRLNISDMIKQATQQSASIYRIETLPDGHPRIPSPMQTIEAHAVPDGLTVVSTNRSKPGSFSIRATSLGRFWGNSKPVQQGRVIVQQELVRIVHPELTEELTTSAEGIQQDFLIPTAPEGSGELALELCFTDVSLHVSGNNISITLPGGRTLLYHRLLVTDSAGKTLPSRFELAGTGKLRIVVADTGAVYPLRIDPTITDTNWLSIAQPDTDYSVLALVYHGNELYAGGSFTAIGGIPANRIAKWNGSEWSPLGSGMDGDVKTMVSDGTTIYVGGGFTSAGGVANTAYIAKWNGSEWSPLGSGMNASVLAMAWDSMGTNLYAAGSFITAGGVSANYIAKWNGSVWSPLGSGMNGSVAALAWDGTSLHAGGFFTSAGGVLNTKYIATWNGSAWSALGTGMQSTVYALAWDGAVLYAGGGFTNAGGQPNTAYIARWKDNTWSALGSGMDSYVQSLTLDASNNLYAGGYFFSAGGVSTTRIAKWNGSIWSPLGSGMDNVIFALTWDGTTLYSGGGFISAGGVTASKIAAWNGSAWSPLGTGMNGSINAMMSDGNTIYVGGSFTTAGGISASRIATWNGSAWSPLGTGVDGDVLALAWDSIGKILYAGGKFTKADGGNASRIATWNGSTWSPLGSGMSFPEINDTSVYVAALTWDGNNLYAGGKFSRAGGIQANRIAKWDGNTWSPLGSGTDNDVLALTWGGGNLYAGGRFTSAGGVANTAYIARWDGNVWLPLGGGTTGNVYALAWDGSNLFAGGGFTYVYNGAAPIPANRIAKWDSNAWSAIGNGTNGPVLALGWDGSNLYAGGSFTSASGGSATRIARWNGNTWSPLGSGMNADVNALNLIDSKLYAGGAFTTAGDIAARVAYFKTVQTVTFNSNGGSAVATQNVYYSGTASVPASPAREGFSFAGWYSDAELRSLFDFATPIKVDTTLYAKWTCTLSIIFNGDGSGSVVSNPAGVNCQNACSKDYESGTTLTLTARTSGVSTFNGWSGGYCSGFAPCLIAMTQARSVVADFGMGPPVAMVGQAGFDSIANAYNAAVSGATILARSGNHFIDTMTLNIGTDVIIRGGYEDTFLSQGQPTVLLGVLTIKSGSLTVENIRIKP